MGDISDDQLLTRIPETGSAERAMLREFAAVLRKRKVRNPVARDGLDMVVAKLELLARAAAE